MPHRDQDLAATAWRLVEGIDQKERAEFRTRATGLGPMLQTCGLAATAAFLAAKSTGTGTKEKAYARTADALATHVTRRAGAPEVDRYEFVPWLGTVSPAAYRQAGVAARDFGIWVRRAAEALIPASGAGPHPTAQPADAPPAAAR